MGKKLLKVLGIVLLVIVVAAGGFVVFLTATEYKPAAVEYIDAPTLGEPETPGDSVRIVTWNVGYCGLGAEEDFVMDGGSGDGRPGKETFYAYYEGVLSELGALGADIYLLQEVDADSDRSCNFNEVEHFSEGRNARSSAYALNYSCPFVPFPWPPMGKVTSGILTTSDFAVEGGTAERIALPCPFSWPLRTANLKRCLLITRYALPGTEAELVAVNLHLEAYDDGEGKEAQTAMLLQILQEEYAKGNYVIAGGDFNQSFPDGTDRYPIASGADWTPGTLGDLPAGWRYAWDSAAPTCRLLNQPYSAGSSGTQFYVIDGFILSPNVEPVSVRTQDAEFAVTDHNPVVLEARLVS